MIQKKSVLLMVGLTIMSLFFVNLNELKASTSQSAVLFWRIAAGARATGMGESFVSVADDATATHWNPAGLGKYPLHSEWYEYRLPQKVTLKQIALLKNDVPDNNYARFDIWGITDTDLFHWDGSQWKSWQTVRPGEQALQSFLSKSAGQPEAEKLKLLAHRVAFFNYAISFDSLSSLAERIKTLVP